MLIHQTIFVQDGGWQNSVGRRNEDTVILKGALQMEYDKKKRCVHLLLFGIPSSQDEKASHYFRVFFFFFSTSYYHISPFRTLARICFWNASSLSPRSICSGSPVGCRVLASPVNPFRYFPPGPRPWPWAALGGPRGHHHRCPALK